MLSNSLNLDVVNSYGYNISQLCFDNHLFPYSSSYIGIDYIIAMTSYPKRINETYKAIISLLNQGSNFKVVLCLDKEEFPSIEFVPATIRDLSLCSKFEYIFCNKNLKIFKKSLYARKMYPNLPIMTCDDDLWYCDCFCDIMWSMYKACKDKIISWNYNKYLLDDSLVECGAGYAMMYPPSVEFTDMYEKLLTDDIVNTTLDDEYNSFIAGKLGIKYHWVLPDSVQKPGILINNTFNEHNDRYWENRLDNDRRLVFKLAKEQYDKVYGTHDNADIL